MLKSIVEIQQEQTRQAEALLLANRQGTLTWAELQSDEFDRPPNLEVVRVSSPKYVSKSSTENAVTPSSIPWAFPVTCGRSQETKVGTNLHSVCLKLIHKC